MRFIPVLLILLALFCLPSCYILTAYKHRHFKLESLPSLRSTQLHKSDFPFYFRDASAEQPQLKRSLDSILAPTHTYSFLVIRNDSILYEHYFDGVEQYTQLPSFSVAKSFVGTLVGIALEEGKIHSLSEPITNYLPELKKRDPAFQQVTIQHLMDMRSGIKSLETGNNPFSRVVQLGFANHISHHVTRIKTEKAPGTWEYKNLNTQLLALIVERATQCKLQDYLQNKIWTPLQMESDATWNMDKQGSVRAFCCINAITRDFAKLGRLYLNQGNWNGNQIVSAEWVKACTSVDTMNRYGGYKNQWWSNTANRYFPDSTRALTYQQQTLYPSWISKQPSRGGNRTAYRVSYRYPAFHAEGILSQYIYVHPLKKVIIVRLGYNWGKSSFSPKGLLYWLGEQL